MVGELPPCSPFSLGGSAILQALEKAPELNGEAVVVEGFSMDKGRYQVVLKKNGRAIMVRLANLRAANGGGGGGGGAPDGFAAPPPPASPDAAAPPAPAPDGLVAAAEALASSWSWQAAAAARGAERAALLEAERAALLEALLVRAGGAPAAANRGAQEVLLRALLDSWRLACDDVMGEREGIKADVAHGCCGDFYQLRAKAMYNVAQRPPAADALCRALAACGVEEAELCELLGVRHGHEVPRPLHPLPWDGVLELNASRSGCHDGGLPDPRGGPPRRGWVTDKNGREARKHMGGGEYMVSVSYTNQRGECDDYE